MRQGTLLPELSVFAGKTRLWDRKIREVATSKDPECSSTNSRKILLNRKNSH